MESINLLLFGLTSFTIDFQFIPVVANPQPLPYRSALRQNRKLSRNVWFVPTIKEILCSVRAVSILELSKTYSIELTNILFKWMCRSCGDLFYMCAPVCLTCIFQLRKIICKITNLLNDVLNTCLSIIIYLFDV